MPLFCSLDPDCGGPCWLDVDLPARWCPAGTAQLYKGTTMTLQLHGSQQSCANARKWKVLQAIVLALHTILAGETTAVSCASLHLYPLLSSRNDLSHILALEEMVTTVWVVTFITSHP